MFFAILTRYLSLMLNSGLSVEVMVSQEALMVLCHSDSLMYFSIGFCLEFWGGSETLTL